MFYDSVVFLVLMSQAFCCLKICYSQNCKLFYPFFLVQNFIHPMKIYGILSMEEVDTIFSNIEVSLFGIVLLLLDRIYLL